MGADQAVANRLGILLEFLWFWLAAPEILGEERPVWLT